MAPRSVTRSISLFVISIPLVCIALEVGVALTLAHLMGMILLGLAAATWLRSRPPLPVDLALASALAFALVGTVTVLRVQFEPNIEIIGESTHAKSIKQLIGLGFGMSV